MKVALHPCYILHQRSYRETSLILEIFSRDYGRLSLVAKGAKKRKSNNSLLMQPNQRLNIAWSIRGEMGTLTAIESDRVANNLTGQKVLAAFYLNELLMRLLHRHDSHLELFDAYDKALLQLHETDTEQPTLRIFEKRLLHALGYGLVLDHDVVSGEAIDVRQDYYYQIDYGPMATKPSVSDYINITGRALIGLQQEILIDQQSLEQTKQLMRRTLKRHLGSKPLASRELYHAYLENISKN